MASTSPSVSAVVARMSLLSTVWYSILGVCVAVESDSEDVLRHVDETYAAFRCAPPTCESAIHLYLWQLDNERVYVVGHAQGYERRWHDQQDALLDLRDRIVGTLLAELHAQGIHAIHAGSVSYHGGALILAGQSGQGKTTLVLGLIHCGLSLLSDELAVVEPATHRILPYRRSLHIRPGTIELIPWLRFLEASHRLELGGGSEWALTPQRLERALPACLGSAAPLRYVLLLEGVPSSNGCPAIIPIPAALAALELLRGTWATSVDFEGGLNWIAPLLDGIPCARLRVGALEPTLDAVTAWLEANRD